MDHKLGQTILSVGRGGWHVLTSPTCDKVYYVVQLCFEHSGKVSNNISKYEGLLARLRATIALGVECVLIKGDSHLLVNLSNKKYKPEDDHMAPT